MKKLSLFTLVIIYAINISGADSQNPDIGGFKIEGLDEVVSDAAAKVIADAANRLNQETIPALEKAVNNSLREAKPVLKGAVKEALVEAAQPILISTAGLLLTSAGIMLVYQGLKADSTQENEPSSKKVNTTKLIGYGSGLVILGVATIMHTSIRNYFDKPKI